jgi:hypothetical protein
MYLLLKRLFREARLAPLFGQFVTQGEICRRNCPKVRRKNQKLEAAWDKYMTGEVNPYGLMKLVR